MLQSSRLQGCLLAIQVPFAMSGSIWQKVAGLSGAAAVGLGAYGAHAFKPQDPYFLEVSTVAALHMCMLTLQLARPGLGLQPQPA